jgi:hypothetical protein
MQRLLSFHFVVAWVCVMWRGRKERREETPKMQVDKNSLSSPLDKAHRKMLE